jgi:N-acetylglutamate synthase-like GNAT family acetyltransferase
MSEYRTRRATVEDLPHLAALWTAVQLPAAELEKQFTDFQVAEDGAGKVAGAIALQVNGSNGRIHSEAFVDFALSDELRPVLWARLLTVAQNHGLFRLWTMETAPWWKKDAGFSAPPDELLQKLPASFGAAPGAWLTLRLKEETADPERLEKELEAFKEAERLKREKLVAQAQVIRIIGTLISALLLVFALIVLFWVMRHRHH